MFKKFQSINNDYNDKSIKFFRDANLLEGQWYATEKIHGTNFSAIVTKDDITWCQRSMIIPADTGFFNHTNEVYQIEQELRILRDLFGVDIQVYFEYYSGAKDIVGAGSIPYRNDGKKGFVAFDIRNVETNTFYDYPENILLLQRSGLPTVHVITKGTFDELMAIENNRKSDLAASFGIDTFSEGMVLKPFVEKQTETGERVIVKRVSELFRENKVKDIFSPKDSTVNLNHAEIDSMITEIRLGKVAAKIGVSTNDITRFADLIKGFVIDIIEESENITIADTKYIKTMATPLLKAFFKKQ